MKDKDLLQILVAIKNLASVKTLWVDHLAMGNDDQSITCPIERSSNFYVSRLARVIKLSGLVHLIIIAQVVESHVPGDYVLVEVLYVQAVINGSAVTAVRLDELKKEHRRHKREVETDTFSFRESYSTERTLSVSVKLVIHERLPSRIKYSSSVTLSVFNIVSVLIL